MNPPELKAYRSKNKLTQKALASRLDVSPRTVVAWETGQNPIPKWVADRLSEESQPRLNPRLSYETFVKAQQQAEAKGQTLEEWIADLIKNAVVIGILGAIGYAFLG